MRTTLVFVPPASPTYVPLGIASLVSYLRVNVPQTEILVHDLNIDLWNRLAAQDEPGRTFSAFMRDCDGDFFKPEAYSAYQPLWGTLTGQVAQMGREVQSYLRTGECSESLAAILDMWTTKILADEPDMIGFSVMFLEQTAFSLALAQWIRNQTSRDDRAPLLIFGGAAMTALDISELLVAAPFLDGVLPGEGEQALAMLCHGKPLTTIPEMRTPDKPLPDKNVEVAPLPAEAFVTPDFSAFDLDLYFNPTPVLPMVFSRDCDWRRCRFCAHNFSFQGYRRKEISAFVDDIEAQMTRHGARHFYLADQHVPAESLEQFSDEILRRGLDIYFHLMARPTQDHTARRLAKASTAGCRWISWGIETGSQRLLNLVRKGTRREVIERLMRDSHEVGIANLMMMIFGLPTSTNDDLEQTFDLIEQVYDQVDSIKSSSFVLFDGTPFAQHPQPFGLVVTGREELLRVGETPVHSSRLKFLAKASDGTLMPPPGALEVSQWMQRERWLGQTGFLDTLCCEHLLLYSSLSNVDDQGRPLRPQPRRAA